MQFEHVYTHFYRVARAGRSVLSDGGGPFGFDIHAALRFDALMQASTATRIVETGTCVGDTSEFLALTYPSAEIVTIENNRPRHTIARSRLAKYSNVRPILGDSAQVLPALTDSGELTVFLLDAHWDDEWPLKSELEAIRRGIVAIDDFDIDDVRYGFDAYNGVVCGPALVRSILGTEHSLFVGDPDAHYPFPCLQQGRRAGTGYLAIGTDDAFLRSSPFFGELGPG